MRRAGGGVLLPVSATQADDAEELGSVRYEDGRPIDWVAFYRAEGVGRLRPSGAKHTGLCPLHDNTKTPAFWFTTENGMWKCEAGCGQGGPVKFLSLRRGISTAEANAALCGMAGVERAAPAKRAPKAPYGVAAYAAAKRLDPALLASWGVTEARGAVLIPYAPGSDGGAVRRRGADGRFSWVTETHGGVRRMRGSLGLYGLWLKETWEPGCDVVLVEGESDCHALWSLGIPALGVPGASTFRPEWAAALDGHRALVHDEGDAGAETFVRTVSAALAASGVECAVWATPGEHKDPSALLAAEGAGCAQTLADALRGAQRRESVAAGGEVPDAGVLASWGLVCPPGWVCTARGVSRMSDETQTLRLVTSTPVVITARVADVASGLERVRLAFLRGGKWHETGAERAEAFSARTVAGVLAGQGAQITSENAREVVKWLGALEQANMDAIPVIASARQLGWCGKAFLPVRPEGLVLDLPPGAEDVAAAFRVKGERAAWLSAMCAASLKSDVFRFVLAAGLAPVLLRITGGRIFFVYVWGDSRGGKTAAVKAALSCWGDPEDLMVTFNATMVGLERRAALMRDLPLGIDERQAAAGDQRRLDELVYALTAGTGRVRGARDGGLQEQAHWRTVVVATGEEPLSGTTSKTGVSTRVLEVYGSPFDDEAEAAAMHRTAAAHHGHAGPGFVEGVLALGEDAVREVWTDVRAGLDRYQGSYALAHLDGVATVAAADALFAMFFLGTARTDAVFDAAEMGARIMERIELSEASDVDASACLWLEGWLSKHADRFDGTFGPYLGERRGDEYLVYTGEFRQALEERGFSYRKTMKALGRTGALPKADGRHLTTSAWVRNEQRRVVWIDATKLGARQTPIQEAL